MDPRPVKHEHKHGSGGVAQTAESKRKLKLRGIALARHHRRELRDKERRAEDKAAEQAFAQNMTSPEGPILTSKTETEKELGAVLDKLRTKLLKLKQEGRQAFESWAKNNNVPGGDLPKLLNPCSFISFDLLDSIAIFRGKSSEERLETAKKLLGTLAPSSALSEKQKRLVHDAWELCFKMKVIAEMEGKPILDIAHRLGVNEEILKALRTERPMDALNDEIIYSRLKKAIPGDTTHEKLITLESWEKAVKSDLDSKQQLVGCAKRVAELLNVVSGLEKKEVSTVSKGLRMSNGLVQALLAVDNAGDAQTYKNINSNVRGETNNEKMNTLAELERMLEMRRQDAVVEEQKAEADKLIRTIHRLCGNDKEFIQTDLAEKIRLLLGIHDYEARVMASVVEKLESGTYKEKDVYAIFTFAIMEHGLGFQTIEDNLKILKTINSAINNFEKSHPGAEFFASVKRGCLEEFGWLSKIATFEEMMEKSIFSTLFGGYGNRRRDRPPQRRGGDDSTYFGGEHIVSI